MADPDEIFGLAERAVEDVVLDIDEALADVWREVSPDAIGLNNDDWLETSKQMVTRFNELAEGAASISIGEPERLQYRTQDLIEFVGAIAEAAEQVA